MLGCSNSDNNNNSSAEPFASLENGSNSKRKRRPAGTPGLDDMIHVFCN